MASNDKMRVVSIAGATGGGTQSLTVSGFGTPTCAIFITSRATDNAVVDASGVSIGFTDGTNEVVHGSRGRDNTNNEQADHIVAIAGQLGWILGSGANPSSGDADFSFSQWVTDGVEISWNTAPSTAVRITVILIQCKNAQVGTLTVSGAGASVTTVMSPAFPPQTVFVAGASVNEQPETPGVNFKLGFGVADYNGTTVEQGCLQYFVSDGDAVGDPNAIIEDALINSNPDPSVTEEIFLEAFDSDSFDTTTTGASSFVGQLSYLSIEWNSVDRKVANFDAPTGTATVNKSFTWPGFKPQCVITGFTNVTSVGTKTTGNAADPIGIGIFDEENSEDSISWAHEDGSAKSNTNSRHSTNGVKLVRADGTDIFDANIGNGSMDTNGYTLEFTTIPSSGVRKWLGFALEEEGAAPAAVPTRMLLTGVGI